MQDQVHRECSLAEKGDEEMWAKFDRHKKYKKYETHTFYDAVVALWHCMIIIRCFTRQAFTTEVVFFPTPM